MFDGAQPPFANAPAAGARFAPAPAAASSRRSYDAWRQGLEDYAYQNRTLTLWSCARLKEISKPGESEGDFRVRLRQAVRESRDAAIEKLRQQYAPRVASLQEQVRKAEERVSREKSQFAQQTFQTVVSIGATVLGALMGRKAVSVGSMGRAATAMRSAGRAAREGTDVGRAAEGVEALRQRLADLDAELQKEIEGLKAGSDDSDATLEEIVIRPRKSDVAAEAVGLAWIPWQAGADGLAAPLT